MNLRCTDHFVNRHLGIDENSIPPPVCTIQRGRLTKECLSFLAKAAGLKEEGAIYKAINGDPDGCLRENTIQNRKWKAVWQLMKKYGNIYPI